MKKYKQQYIYRNIFYSKFIIIVFIILIGFLLNGLYKIYLKYQFTKADLISVNKEKEEENKKLFNVKNKLEEINRESGKEKYIRETYSVIKPGENIVTVYNSPASTFDIKKKESFWSLFTKYFMDFFR